jgi:adenylate cyclase
MLATGVALVMILGLFIASESGLPLRLENVALDLRFRLRPQIPQAVPLVVVGIDDKSIAQIGRWPWSRVVLARFVERMQAAGAKVIVIDLLFTEAQPSPIGSERGAIETAIAPLVGKLSAVDRNRLQATLDELARADDADALLASAMRRHGAVVIGFAVDLPESKSGQQRPAGAPAALQNSAYRRRSGDAHDDLPAPNGYELPIGPLARSALLGHVTTVADAAGTFHYDYPVLPFDDGYVPSLSLQAVRTFLGLAPTDVVVDVGRAIDLKSLRIPTDEGMRLLVNDYPVGTFEPISFADALTGRVSAQAFAGKIVLLGVTASAAGDVIATPFTPALPGVERHATLIKNMLNADFLRRDNRYVALDALIVLLSALGLGLVSRQGTIALTLGAATMLGGVAALDYAAFVGPGVWLNFTFPAAAIVTTFGLILGGKYSVERHQTRWIRRAFSHYLHADLVEQMCRAHCVPRLGGEECVLTVLFADVRDFSRVAEGLPAPQLVRLLNEFFSALTDVVLRHHGMLDKYIGDGLMAVFGAPVADPDHALHACRAALGMRTALAALHAGWRAEGRPCLEVRIGINTGSMVIGNIGTQSRFDYTVIGDEVNIASRLEAANKSLGTGILISAATATAAGSLIDVRPLGTISVKGRDRSVEVFELLALTEDGPGASLAPARVS